MPFKLYSVVLQGSEDREISGKIVGKLSDVHLAIWVVVAAVDVWIESNCANMQSVAEIEVKHSKKMRSNQSFRIPSVFK